MNYVLLNPVSVETLLVVVAIVAVLAVAFAVFIVLVSKLCAVPEDEKTEKIKEQLAGANCGGCGYAGCSDFAKALAEGKADISKCGPTPAANKAAIAEILGIPFAAGEEKIAVVHCSGGSACKDKFEYVGNGDCGAQAAFMGGKKACSFGCLGGGTCVKGCIYGAINVENGVADTNRALCEACGVCVKNCPKHIIELIPKSAKVYVACSSELKGREVTEVCANGCIGCGICAKFCPEKAITLSDNLPVIDYKKCSGCLTCATKCPRKCIKVL